MDIENFRIIVEDAIRQADPFKWWLYLILIVIAGAASFLGSYLRRKAEQIAIKENIAEITLKIEQVRFDFSKSIEEVLQQNRIVLENFKTRRQLRLAALDRRLKVHQEAFALWRKLLSSVHDKEGIGSVVMECQDWWDENCLYLEPDARQAFNNCYRAAFLHRDLLEGIQNLEDIDENWSRIIAAGEVIIKAVELPAIKDLETEVLKLDENQKA